MVAIHDNPGIKHWGLFIEAKEESEKTVISLLGARQRYFCIIGTPAGDVPVSTSPVEMCPVCNIETSRIETVKNIVWDTPVPNELSDYSCQDFVIELLDRLEGEGIVDGTDGHYTGKYEYNQGETRGMQ